MPQTDEHTIDNKNITRLVVSRDGNHGFILADNEIYYNHWGDHEFFRIDNKCCVWPKATRFTSIDIFVEDGAQDFF
jgi:hypothetical protein